MTLDQARRIAVITEAVLNLQQDAQDDTLSVNLEDGVQYRAQIHQDSGMVAVQPSISAADAVAVHQSPLVRDRLHRRRRGG
jgi:hypothetical protein